MGGCVLKKYNPNWRDPRVQRRINQSLDYALANLSPTKPKEWSTRQIDRWFGNQGNPLSKMIREQLLTTHDPYYNPERGQAKKYLLNVEGAHKLALQVGRTVGTVPAQLHQSTLESADRIYGKQIASGVFEYKEKSNRLWNDIQHLDNTTRKPLFANYGYVYEYDIKSSAPNILVQYAKNNGLDAAIPTIENYLRDPDLYRTKLQTLLGCNRKTAKQLITSRFAGARFGKRNSIINQLEYNWHQYNLLKDDEWFEQLTREIKSLWDCLKKDLGLSRINAKHKWDLYFSEELRVMRSVHKYMDKTSVRYFHEHDGWRSTGAVDLHQLKLHVRKQTGYWLEFDEEVYETTHETADYS